MTNSGPGPCPICETSSTLTIDFDQKQGRFDKIECPRCGEYEIADYAEGEIRKSFEMDQCQVKINTQKETPSVMNKRDDLYIEVAKKGIEQYRSIISHVLRKSNIKIVIRPADLFSILKEYSSPTPAE